MKYGNWSDSEKETLALYVLTSLSERKSVKEGVNNFIRETNSIRTSTTCFWRWSTLKHNYSDELAKLGHPIKQEKDVKKKVRSSSDSKKTVIEPKRVVPEITSVNLETIQSNAEIDGFTESFNNFVNFMNDFREKYNRLEHENEVLRQENRRLSGAFSSAKEELEVFIRAFQISSKPEHGVSNNQKRVTTDRSLMVEKIESIG